MRTWSLHAAAGVRRYLAFALFCLMPLMPLTVAQAAEFFLAGGHATYARCGVVGCWEMPPLKSEWRTSTGVYGLGFRVRSWEFAYRDFGRVTVHGFYVPDEDYDPSAQALREGARQWRGLVQQQTRGASLLYWPRFEWGPLQLGLGLGPLIYRQHTTFDIDWLDGLCCNTDVNQVGVDVSAMWGLSLGWAMGRTFTLQYSFEQVHRLRNNGDVPAGGGSGSRPGVTMHALVLRYDL